MNMTINIYIYMHAGCIYSYPMIMLPTNTIYEQYEQCILYLHTCMQAVPLLLCYLPILVLS